MADSPPERPPAAIEIAGEDGRDRIRFRGSFTVHDKPPSEPAPFRAEDRGRPVVLDGSAVDRWDSVLLVRLRRIREAAREAGRPVEEEGFPDTVELLLSRLESDEATAPAASDRPGRESVLARVGGFGLEAYGGFKAFLVFLGETAQSVARLLRGRAVYRGSDLLDLLWENGGRSRGIVFLISFLTGLILAFVGAIQLDRFGANIFVADLVAIAMFREMGAMMTGIILAGRTGSAFAAQIGSMKANDELNALQTMGISAFDFIVLPRLAALSLMMPVLAFLAALSGVFGGMLVSVGFMDVTATQYLQQTAAAVGPGTFFTGIVKSVVFGGIIAVTGCFRGMAAGSSAEAVGRAATAAVVVSIVWIIVADAVFAVICNLYGI